MLGKSCTCEFALPLRKYFSHSLIECSPTGDILNRENEMNGGIIDNNTIMRIRITILCVFVLANYINNLWTSHCSKNMIYFYFISIFYLLQIFELGLKFILYMARVHRLFYMYPFQRHNYEKAITRSISRKQLLIVIFKFITCKKYLIIRSRFKMDERIRLYHLKNTMSIKIEINA